MAVLTPDQVRETIDTIYRQESSGILATLIRLLGDFDQAEEALQNAYVTAVAQWPSQGIPERPRAWLISTARFKGIDAIRRQSRVTNNLEEIADRLTAPNSDLEIQEVHEVSDDTLRLIFTCCHPALSMEARVALTLREVCGLSTDEIGRAFLTPSATIGQRIVRAKSKIRNASIPYRVPNIDELPDRLGTVLQVVYLVFNEGYSASSGDSLMRPDVSREAIRLGRRLKDLLPEPEVQGLLALMLLQESRRRARTNELGDIVLLSDQDRSLWDSELIEEGKALVEASLITKKFGPYTIQAAIAALHSEALNPADTDWQQIAALYGVLLAIAPSPVIELNRAVAIAMVAGPNVGIDLVDRILDRGDLPDYHLIHSARGELCYRAGRHEESRASYLRALDLARQMPERRFLEGQINRLDSRLQ